MAVRPSRHQDVLKELAEWWEDIHEAGIGSRVVLLEVPRGWGATTVLREFSDIVVDPDAPVTICVSVDKVPLGDRAIEAKALRDTLMTPFVRSRLVQLLELDSPAGKTGLALGVGGLFVSGMAVQASLLLASLGVTAAGNAWDASPAGQQGTVARAARAVAAVSAEVPVAVLIDDADRLDPDLAATMIDNLASRYDGRVLVVAAVNPGSALGGALRVPDRYGLLGRVLTAEADPDMSAESRVKLARELCPCLPDVATERIGRRTFSFAEVFAVIGEERLTDIPAASGLTALEIVDAVIDATVARGEVSAQARVLAWAGGALTTGQADKALDILKVGRDQGDDPEVVRAEGLARLRDPASSHIREQTARLAISTRRRLAASILAEAVGIARDPDATLVQRTVARLAAHRVRSDLDPLAELTAVQCLLIRGLEQLGDPVEAWEVASAALTELPAEAQAAPQRTELLKAWLRLARTRPRSEDDPHIQEAIDLAVTNGALLGPEARVWAAVNLLGRLGQRDVAIQLTDQITADLATYPGRDASVNQWRLLLAFHIGQSGYFDAAHRLLAPIINGGNTRQQEAAQAVLRAIESPQADIRLQITILDEELQATPARDYDELYRLHRTLAMDYDAVGNYPRALEHGTEALRFGLSLNGPDHPSVLTIRHDIAAWTGHCGDPHNALVLFQELLPDLVRVFGRDRPYVLTARGNIALWTGRTGDAEGALLLFQELLPDMVRVLGRDHRHVLTARGSIALWTGRTGDAEGALLLFQELLPDAVRLLGRDRPYVLTVRGNIAVWTSWCGDEEGALRLFQKLLPDELRVLGRDHPETLDTHSKIAALTRRSGDTGGALRLFQELLPDQLRVFRPDHPDVLDTRSNIAALTGWCGDAEGALRLFQELLPDQLRVLGHDHPEVLITRGGIILWTAQAEANARSESSTDADHPEPGSKASGS